MAKRYQLKNSNILVTLSSKPFAGGGEGNLYVIVSPKSLRKYVAKLYHPHKLSKTREDKINYLSEYAPLGTEENSEGHNSVVWVKDALYDRNKFIGFIMPYTEGEKLEILCTPKIPKKHRRTWGRFEFGTSSKAVDLRLKLCFNICAAIHQVHSMERYVLVDMKPDNIVIQPNGLVSIVDTDSVEVVEENKSLFDAPVATPEYTPPEHYQELNYDPTEREEWDRFGLGVILYKLMFGIHPFAASSGPPYEQLTSLHDKIKHGLFVHHPAKKNAFNIIPPPHKDFYKLDKTLQEMFMRCFIDGHENPSARPSAEEWCAAILLALDDAAAYKRYGHILGVGIKSRRPRFLLPSSKIDLPIYSDAAYRLVELNENSHLPIPKLKKPSVDQLKTFNIQSLTKGECTALIIFLAFVSIFGTPLFGAVIGGLLLYRTHKKYEKNPLVQQEERIKKQHERTKKKFDRQKRTVYKTRRKFKRSVRRIVPKIKRFTKKIKTEIDELKRYLQEQDERVRDLENKALEQYKLLNQKYVNQAKSNRLVARIEDGNYDSLAKIRIALNNTHKKAVDELIKEHPINDRHPSMREGKIAVNSLVKDKRIKIDALVKDKVLSLYQEEDAEVNLLYKDLRQDTNLYRHIDRLWKGVRRRSDKAMDELKETLGELNFQSILQIYAVNTRTGMITLKDGRKFHVKAFKNHKIVLKNLSYWLDQTKHQMASLNKEKIKIKRKYREKVKAIENEKRIELKDLERFKRGELQKVKVAVQKVVLGTPYVNLQTQYETITEYVDELEAAYEKEEKVVLNDYQLVYDRIIEKSEEKAREVAEEIKEAKERLGQYTKKVNHPKVQKYYRELEEELRTLNELLPKLEANSFEWKKYENVNFNNYIRTLTRWS